MKGDVEFIGVERFRVEGFADPLAHLLVLLIIGVRKRGEHVCISPDTADVLGRAGPLPRDTPGILAAGLEWGHGLQHDLVLPPVTEVVRGCQLVLWLNEDLLQDGFPLVLVHLIHIRLVVRQLVDDTLGDELVQVAVGLAHDHLKHSVELCERNAAGHQEPPPYRWSQAKQCYFELIDRLTGGLNPHVFLLAGTRSEVPGSPDHAYSKRFMCAHMALMEKRGGRRSRELLGTG